MGMSASSYNLFFYTSRKNAIEEELVKNANAKTACMREVRALSQEYQNAISQKRLKWSNNNGVSYIDLSYGNLMSPSNLNQNRPYLITNSAGKVVVNDKYLKYAQIISPNGTPVSDWENRKTALLAQVTGIEESKITDYQAHLLNIDDLQNQIAAKKANKPQVPVESSSLSVLLEKAGKVSDTGKFWKVTGGTIDLGNDSSKAESLAKKYAEDLFNKLDKYLNHPGLIDDYKDYKQGMLDGLVIGKNYTIDDTNQKIYKNRGGNYILNLNALAEFCLVNFKNDEGNYNWYDVDDQEYIDQQAALETWEKDLADLEERYTNTTTAADQLLTIDQENALAYYDAIFSSIADSGWVYDEKINNPDYFNEILQNNQYTITTVNRSVKHDDGKCYFHNQYSSDIASNFTNIFFVNDTDAADQATVNYEYRKGILQEKQTRLDTRSANLKTELESLNTIIEGTGTVIKENIERTLNITG